MAKGRKRARFALWRRDDSDSPPVVTDEEPEEPTDGYRVKPSTSADDEAEGASEQDSAETLDVESATSGGPSPSHANDLGEEATTGGSHQWLSSEPVIVGTPGPIFEPVATGHNFHPTPYRSDAVLDGWSTDAFTVRAASLRGHLHRYDGAPRQDDFALRLRSGAEQLVFAVADGVGGADQSHIGSTAAVRYAVQWLDASLTDPIEDIDWTKLVGSVAWTLVEQASKLFGVGEDAEQAERLIATTLICGVVERSTHRTTAHVVGVGDSGVWLLSDGQINRVEGGKDADASGISSSAVQGLPRVPNTVSPTQVPLAPGDVLLVGTDGFGDPLGSATGELGRLFIDMMGAGRVPSMFEFGHKLNFSRETFDDDRTLIAIWPRRRDDK